MKQKKVITMERTDIEIRVAKGLDVFIPTDPSILSLSPRAFNLMQSANCHLVSQLDERVLIELPASGEKTVRELLEWKAMFTGQGDSNASEVNGGDLVQDETDGGDHDNNRDADIDQNQQSDESSVSPI